jgi:hypothetical protein
MSKVGEALLEMGNAFGPGDREIETAMRASQSEPELGWHERFEVIEAVLKKVASKEYQEALAAHKAEKALRARWKQEHPGSPQWTATQKAKPYRPLTAEEVAIAHKIVGSWDE